MVLAAATDVTGSRSQQLNYSYQQKQFLRRDIAVMVHRLFDYVALYRYTRIQIHIPIDHPRVIDTLMAM